MNNENIVSKSLLPPQNIERFINFLSPNASQNNGATINFKDLSNVNIQSIGVFGTKQQICDMLLKLGGADNDLYVLLCFALFCFAFVLFC